MNDMYLEVSIQFEDMFGWIASIFPHQPIEVISKMDTVQFLLLLGKAETEQTRRLNQNK